MMKPFEHYLVGGAVRDALLGLPVRERDWVVVGETPETMLARSFIQVGRDFPVFLHPETGEEYALARTERKTGPGHTGFSFEIGAGVTLEDDLLRRDLTINAIAQKPDGSLVDPFGGQVDIKAKVLRHVSPAFSEDPLRVFRLCRFAATLPGFKIAEETCQLVRELALSGSLQELPSERVWSELHKALRSDNCERFWQSLERCGATAPWFIELTEATNVVPGDELNRYASLGWQLANIDELNKRLKVPKDYQVLSESVARDGRSLADWKNLSPEAVFQNIKRNGALRRSPLFDRFVEVIALCAEADLVDLVQLVVKVQNITRSDVAADLQGKALGAAIKAAQIQAINQACR